MSDMRSNDKAQANMRLKDSDNFNTSGKNGVVLNPPKQEKTATRQTHQVEVGTGKRI
jgi:hypothetical protein